MNRMLLAFASLALLLTPTRFAFAYPVGPSLTLEKLIEESDLICKATAVETKPVEDAWFEKVHGYRPYETRLKVIAVFRGAKELKEITFRHYGDDEKEQARIYEPQHYKFEVGRTYILFAKKGDAAGQYRQLWKNHRAQEDQGLLLAANTDPRPALTIKEVISQELADLLQSDKVPDVKYALAHLDTLSGGDYRDMQDLDRERTLALVAPLIKRPQPEIAQAAIAALGSSNPYMSQDYLAGWLATVGKGHIPGYGAWDLTRKNLGGKLYWKDLAALVNSDAPTDTRALAVRALGRSETDEVLPLAEKWVRDGDPKVRRAAAVLLADYPKQANTKLLQALTRDPDPLARQGAAQAIGCGQFAHLLPEFGQLVDDPDPKVSAAAALSLLSFSLEESRTELKAHLAHPQYHSLFVNALAHEDAEPYLDQLCEIVRKNKQPENWWGGFVVWGDSWNVLYKHVQAQPAGKLQGAKFVPLFEALEYPASGDAKGPHYYSSSEPRDLYALYLQRGLLGRAKQFRAACKKSISYDIDYYFNMVDERPKDYGAR